MKIDPCQLYFFPESVYGGFSDADGTVRFFHRVQAMLPSAGSVLDVGCGRGRNSEDWVPYRRQISCLQGKHRRVVGIDVDAAAASNPFIDEFVHLSDPDADWPLADSSFDLASCTYVLEHVPSPPDFFAQIYRVLKPGGTLCLRTSNLMSYLGVAATIIPNALHSRVLKLTGDRRKENDIFPTLYRCNTSFKLVNTLKRAGFIQVVVRGYGGEASYLRFSRLSYWAGLAYHRLLPHFLQPALFAYATKPA